ncbi:MULTISPECIES: hypothetical protein [unclassified Brenneria]|uniref:hypothetical protein n=1 Tax=unclassified Brenneria TaxID=2634434 RepID=UPI0029C23EEA|nr:MULTISPECIES: hypothetical protein [unclassified Brenneria]MDX5630105.1 hypothetical protein [Brenneria sp. L3-3Z]MDX5697286.1 hypothetical protein [Brenneria sp. L4-2C]
MKKITDDVTRPFGYNFFSGICHRVRIFFSPRGRMLFAILSSILLYMILTPPFFDFFWKISDSAEIHYSTGQLMINNKGKNAPQIGVLPEKKRRVEYFYCFFGCGIKKELLTSWVGKSAEIGWVEEPVYHFLSRKRLVTLKVEGVEQISFDKGKALFERDKMSLPYLLFFCASFFSIFILFAKEHVRKSKKRE